MYPIEAKRGRRRRRPFAAHNARAILLRAENARRSLGELILRLSAETEVMRDLYVERKSDVTYLYAQGPVLDEVLGRIIRHLADPGAREEGQADV